MALHPDCFKRWEPLPDKGTMVRVHLKDGTTVDGVVELVWLAMDELAFKIRLQTGKLVNILMEIDATGWQVFELAAFRPVVPS